MNQIQLYEKFIQLGEKLKDPAHRPSLFAQLTQEQIELCYEIIKFLSPQADTTTTTIEKLDNLSKAIIAYQAPRNWKQNAQLIALRSFDYIYQNDSRKLYDQFQSEVFKTSLDNFKLLAAKTKARQEKVEAAETAISFTSLEVWQTLPNEIRATILGMTDLRTMNAYKVLCKESQGILGAQFAGLDYNPHLWLGFSATLNLKNVSAENAKIKVLGFLRTTSLEFPTESGLPVAYKNDARFQELFERIPLNTLIRKGLKQDTMELLGKWNKVKHINCFRQILTRNKTESLEIHNLIQLAAEFPLFFNEKQGEFAEKKLLAISGLDDFPSSFSDLHSLEDLTLSQLEMEFPEIITSLNLKKLVLENNLFSTIPDSIAKLQTLETLEIDQVLDSLDFILELRNLKKVIFAGNPNALFLKSSLDRLKRSSDLKLIPKTLSHALMDLSICQTDFHVRQQIYWVDIPKLLRNSSSTTIDTVLNNMKRETLSIEDMLFVADALAARDKLVVLNVLALHLNSIDPDFSLGVIERRVFASFEEMIEFSSGLPLWFNDSNLKKIKTLDLSEYYITFLPEFLWNCGLDPKKLVLGGHSLVYPSRKQLNSFHGSIESLTVDSNAPHFIRELVEIIEDRTSNRKQISRQQQNNDGGCVIL